MTVKTPWRLTVLIVATSTVIALAVIAIVGEIAVRYRESHRSSVPGGMPFLFYRHSRLGYALVRRSSYFNWVHVDAQGFRGSADVSREKRHGVTRIMAVGGSTTFDSFVTDDSAAWPARLNHWLGVLDPDHPVEVINAGVPGYTVAQDLIRLETELREYAPDIIILYQGHNDLISNLRPIAGLGADTLQQPGEVQPITPWRAWLERHSLLYAKLAQRIKLKRFGKQPANDPTMRFPDNYGASEFEVMVLQYLAVANAMNIRVVIPEVVQISGSALHEADPNLEAMWRATIPYSVPDTTLLGYHRYNEVLRTLSERMGSTFIPMVDLGISGAQYYSPDDPLHFNDRGADRFAEGLAKRLLAANILP